MPRGVPRTTNGSIPASVAARARARQAASGRVNPNERFLAADPITDPPEEEAIPDGGMFASNPSTAVDGPDESGGVLAEFTGASAGAVGQGPAEIQIVGPNGEVLTARRQEDGTYLTVSTNVPPPPVSAEVDHPLLQQLRSRTKEVKKNVQRAPAYNHRMLWYMKRDGEIVLLQGDPGNRAYYEDKGYVVLREEEEQMWLRGQKRSERDPRTGDYRQVTVVPPIRKLVLDEQRRRAILVGTITNIARRNPSVELTGDLSITPTEELEDLLAQLREAQGINFRLLEARERSRREDYDDETEMVGVELASGHDLYRKMARSREQQRIQGSSRLNPPDAIEMT